MPPATSQREIERARKLILAHGWNSTCYQILNPGFTRWFAPSGDAVVGYVRHRRYRIVGGTPVCAEARLPAVAAAFEADAAREGMRVCYFCAGARMDAIFRADCAHASVLLGAQPVWSPRAWPEMIGGHASLRAQLHRAKNKGVIVSEWPVDRAHEHPALRRCLSEWLLTRGLPPLHFLIETDTLARLFDRRCFVAEREGQVIGFLVASPVPQRNGWLVEQLVRGQAAVNGTAELLLDGAMQAMIALGSDYVTLGLAPLSRRTGGREDRSPIWLKGVLAWMRAHGRRFYNFEGLEAFKAKFRPDHWAPVFAVFNEPRVKPQALYATAAAFANGSPVLLMARAAVHAVAEEARRVKAHFRLGGPPA